MVLKSIKIITNQKISEQVLCEWETAAGKIWLDSGDKEAQYYIGGVAHMEPHGLGVLRHPSGIKYVGEFKNGLPHGQGFKTCLDGQKYFGEWKDGKQHGHGIETFSDGEKYEGEWKDGVYHGHGLLTLPDGAKYEGEWKDGVKYGQGTLSFPGGEKCEGDWKDGKEKWLEKESYSEDTNLNDECKHYFFDGDKLDINREDIITFEWGILTFPDGKKYTGEWKPNSGGVDNGENGYKEGLEHGRLTYSADDGLRYQGEWQDGQYQEIVTSSDGLKYESRV